MLERAIVLTNEISRTRTSIAFCQYRYISSYNNKTWNIRTLPKGMTKFTPLTPEHNPNNDNKEGTKLISLCNKIELTYVNNNNNKITNREANMRENKETREIDNVEKEDMNGFSYKHMTDEVINNTCVDDNIALIRKVTQNKRSKKMIEFLELPPWPVDSVEYNTRVANGGHDKRLTYERRICHLEKIKMQGEEQEQEEEQQEQEEEEREEELCENASVNVCKYNHKCYHRNADNSNKNNKYRINKSTTRQTTATREEDHEQSTSNNEKYEAHNEDEETDSAVADADPELQHIRVADEIRCQPVGRIINVRNRFNRWACAECKELNSLQSTQCRRCGHERFNLTLRCTHCNSTTTLDNKLVYGNEMCDAAHYTNNFGIHNCFARLAPELMCPHCHKSFHGAAVEISGRRSWWCACGYCSHNIRQSCMRCRLPRTITLDSILLPLLQHKWDFRDSTCWYCEACDGVNRASRYVVALFSPLARQLMREHQELLYNKRLMSLTEGMNKTDNNNNINNNDNNNNPNLQGIADNDVERGFLRSHGVGQDGLRKEARLIAGDVSCRHCGLPWHHQLLRDGGHWRCACHVINNSETDKQCKVCQLPAFDGLSVNVISLWHHGDWFCSRCHRHCYRLRPQCVCGARRANSEYNSL